ncbi:hypothetical protein [Bradyrhizobium sp. SZCCHNRI1009]|uniref:hypothetical protein n=1 Tax=Bradyrhizobium sp. SZCCHNRI1009 TaxID=3057277 RepID=UPI002915D9BB|nr:hypothetical protein [Bradyrhizobium sp. SZCCHNRI1009]
MIIQLLSHRAVVNGEQRTPAIAVKFLLLLVYAARSNWTPVVSGRAASVLGIAPGSSFRTAVSRALKTIENKWGLLGAIDYANRTAGPWTLKKDRLERIIIQSENREATLEDIADFIGLDPPPPVPPPVDAQEFAVDTTTRLYPPELAVIVESDAKFSVGALDETERLLQSALTAAKTNSDTLMIAVCLQRLVQVYRANENHANLLLTYRRLKSISKSLSTPHYREFFSASGAVAYAWYLYSFKRRYARAQDVLNNMTPNGLAVSAVRISWLNIQALIQRRLVLALVEEGADPGAVDHRAQNTLSLLKIALYESLMLNSSYQLHQVTANFANVLSAFLTHTRSLDDVQPKRLTRDMFGLLSCSNLLCEFFHFGRDDVYNAIFTLGICRRHQMTFGDFLEVSGEIAPKWTSELTAQHGGLANYGAFEFDRAATMHRGFGLEQRFQLSFEIVWRSIFDADLEVFQKYCDPFAHACWSLQERDEKERHHVRNKVNELRKLLSQRLSRSEKWSDAASGLRDLPL